MKTIDLIGSITSNSTEIYSTTDASWGAIRPGSFITFPGDNTQSVVGDVRQKTYIKEFERIDSKTIKIPNHNLFLFTANDTVLLSYKEYEVESIFEVEDGGNDYEKGDNLSILGGTPSYDIVNDTKQITKLRVIDTKEGGVITKVVVLNGGKYVSKLDDVVFVSGGKGQNAKIRITQKIADERQMVEKDIESIEDKTEDGYLLLHLSYPIPENVTKGKISITKWVIFLTAPYLGQSKADNKFFVARDFTTNYGLQLLTKNLDATIPAMNQNLAFFDAKIKELEDLIKKLSV